MWPALRVASDAARNRNPRRLTGGSCKSFRAGTGRGFIRHRADTICPPRRRVCVPAHHIPATVAQSSRFIGLEGRANRNATRLAGVWMVTGGGARSIRRRPEMRKLLYSAISLAAAAAFAAPALAQPPGYRAYDSAPWRIIRGRRPRSAPALSAAPSPASASPKAGGVPRRPPRCRPRLPAPPPSVASPASARWRGRRGDPALPRLCRHVQPQRRRVRERPVCRLRAARRAVPHRGIAGNRYERCVMAGTSPAMTGASCSGSAA